MKLDKHLATIQEWLLNWLLNNVIKEAKQKFQAGLNTLLLYKQPIYYQLILLL
jgi:hypothetical protein